MCENFKTQIQNELSIPCTEKIQSLHFMLLLEFKIFDLVFMYLLQNRQNFFRMTKER